jgi:hypothetical protein
LSGEGEGKAKKKREKAKDEEEEEEDDGTMAPKTKVDIECMSPNYKGHKS